MDTRHRILFQAFLLFSKYGIRNVSMDDIARELGISKKTIYQIFEDKAAIVYAVSAAKHEEEKKLFQEIAENAEDALDEVVKVMNYLMQTLKSVSPLLIYEIQKYYPEAWQIHTQFGEDISLNQIIENIKKGIKEGYYRQEINPQLVARMRLATIDMLFNSRWFPQGQYDFQEVQQEAFLLFIHGLLTEKGKQRLTELIYIKTE